MRCGRFLALVFVPVLFRAVPAHADSERSLLAGGAVLVSPLASIDFISDGHGPSASGARALGVSAEFAYALVPYLHVGLGLRYTTIPLDSYADETAHELLVPLVLLGSVRLDSGGAIEGVVGVGYTVAFFPDGGDTDDGGALRASGPGGELLFGYVHPVAERLSVTGHAGAQLALLQTDNGVEYWRKSDGIIGAVVVRLGLRFR